MVDVKNAEEDVWRVVEDALLFEFWLTNRQIRKVPQLRDKIVSTAVDAGYLNRKAIKAALSRPAQNLVDDANSFRRLLVWLVDHDEASLGSTKNEVIKAISI